ncbi:MAG: hypothetical protein WD077_12595, partial [Bacteroidia bacterium]
MKKLLQTLLSATFFFLILLIPNTSEASHMMGSDMTWRCIGGDSFQVTITIYRDCNGCTISEAGGACSTVPLTLKPSCGNARTYNMTLASQEDITPVCKSSCTKCESGGCSFPYGIEKLVLTTIVDLSNDNCCDFTLSILVSARNSNIGTGASNQNFYIDGELNKCDTPCNSSPTFSNPPIAILCAGQCFIYNQGVTDVDGDSLVYSLTPPLQSSGNPTTWLSPYTYDKPLYFNGFPNKNLPFNPPLCRGFHLDSFNGDLMFRPMQAQITVLSIKVDEYRNGQKIGTIRRDLQ